VDVIAADLRKGEIDPNTARVLIDAIKWQTGKEAPKSFGDRSHVEHSGDVGLTIIQHSTPKP
jgi:hypothetical protein